MAITQVFQMGSVIGRNTGGFLHDAGENGDCSNGPARYGRTRIIDAARALAKLGMLYRKADGAPSSEKPFVAGSMCFDQTNNDFYVCTDRSSPTWAALTE